MVELPEDIILTSEELINKLKEDLKNEIRREYNAKIYEKNPLKYKKMGLNKYFEKEMEICKKFVIPANFNIALRNLSKNHNINIREYNNYRDTGIIVFDASGTFSNMEFFEKSLESKCNNFSPEQNENNVKTKFVDVPNILEEVIIGKHGLNLYKIESNMNVKIRLFNDNNTFKLKTLSISGEQENVEKACIYISEIIYKSYT